MEQVCDVWASDHASSLSVPKTKCRKLPLRYVGEFYHPSLEPLHPIARPTNEQTFHSSNTVCKTGKPPSGQEGLTRTRLTHQQLKPLVADCMQEGDQSSNRQLSNTDHALPPSIPGRKHNRDVTDLAPECVHSGLPVYSVKAKQQPQCKF